MHKVLLTIAAGLTLAAIMSGSALASDGELPKQPPTPSPAPKPNVYVVQSGDNLSDIAQTQQLESWLPLWNANPSLTNPDLIYAGQQLVIPSGPTTNRPLPADTVAVPTRTYAPAGGQIVPTEPTASDYAPGAPGILERVRMRESGGNYADNTGNGFYGAYQFTLSTWQGVGGSGLPSNASPAEQDMRAQMLHNERGCSPWPNTCY